MVWVGLDLCGFAWSGLIWVVGWSGYGLIGLIWVCGSRLIGLMADGCWWWWWLWVWVDRVDGWWWLMVMVTVGLGWSGWSGHVWRHGDGVLIGVDFSLCGLIGIDLMLNLIFHVGWSVCGLIGMCGLIWFFFGFWWWWWWWLGDDGGWGSVRERDSERVNNKN